MGVRTADREAVPTCQDSGLLRLLQQVVVLGNGLSVPPELGHGDGSPQDLPGRENVYAQPFFPGRLTDVDGAWLGIPGTAKNLSRVPSRVSRNDTGAASFSA